MNSKRSSTLALFLSINLLFCVLASGCYTYHPCCALLVGLVDLEVAVCLCTAIKANILGINLNIPIALSLVIDGCAKNVPEGFKCA
ncbi:14 kDa proline-rich protein DC2.15-like [Pyrus ussuriensis x Pyrus communis]|uniref:14 kDa proline-rich protein DC2.15-like n=1 Tax=Pyrus ussuriensis x Pyrus communis TaxID=2448454 RepID=A0A5N5HD70_9ROSA|nr:14 kDa proline-rich protein DC2.15-like [Pyrus ussuriensis x Pyrus communis]